jgi:hypothetical protein
LKFDLTIVDVDLQAGAEVDRCISTSTYRGGSLPWQILGGK